MPQWMVARYRQVTGETSEYVREHFGYTGIDGQPLPDEGEMVQLIVPGIANPEVNAIRDKSGLTIGWSCRCLGSDELPTPGAPAPAQPEPLVVSEIAVASAVADVIRVDFKLKRRAA